MFIIIDNIKKNIKDCYKIYKLVSLYTNIESENNKKKRKKQ